MVNYSEDFLGYDPLAYIPVSLLLLVTDSVSLFYASLSCMQLYTTLGSHYY